MTVIACTFGGEMITIHNQTIFKALEILRERGVPEDWIFSLEARQDETTE